MSATNNVFSLLSGLFLASLLLALPLDAQERRRPAKGPGPTPSATAPEIDDLVDDLLLRLGKTSNTRVRQAIGAALQTLGDDAIDKVEAFGKDLEDKELRGWVASLLRRMEARKRPAGPDSGGGRGPRRGGDSDPSAGGNRNPEASMERMADLLELSTDQRGKVGELLRKRAQGLRKLQGDEGEPADKAEAVRKLQEELDAGLARILTDEQYRKWKSSSDRGVPRPGGEGGRPRKGKGEKKGDDPKDRDA